MESAIEDAPIDAAPEPGKRPKLPLILVVAGGLLVGGGIGAFLTGPIILAKLRAKPAASAEAPKSEGEGAAKGEHGKAGEGNQKVLRVVDNLVLNPAGSGGTRFLMVTASIEVADAKTDEALKARDAQVRDAMLGYLGRKTVAELSDMGGRDQIKKDLLALLKPFASGGVITAVYFPQFVIQ